MAEMGQIRSFNDVDSMSALALFADSLRTSPEVQEVPTSDICGATKVAYSITSSARPSSGSGMVRPSVLAILRLMTSSTFAQSLPERSKSPRTPKPQHPLSAMSYCHMSFDWCSARGLISYDARFGSKCEELTLSISGPL